MLIADPHITSPRRLNGFRVHIEFQTQFFVVFLELKQIDLSYVLLADMLRWGTPVVSIL